MLVIEVGRLFFLCCAPPPKHTYRADACDRAEFNPGIDISDEFQLLKTLFLPSKIHLTPKFGGCSPFPLPILNWEELVSFLPTGSVIFCPPTKQQNPPKFEMPTTSTSTLIIGAGPCGLCAAARQTQISPSTPSLILDKNPAGGLSSTPVTPENFLFDLGGHVIFSHFQFFDDLIECGKDAPLTDSSVWAKHQRVSYVWIRNRWVPYPFQNNLGSLPKEDQTVCLNGLIKATVASSQTSTTSKPANFNEWIERVMGGGINDIFMRPYNYKVWAYPTTDMSSNWLGERVATADVFKAVENALSGRESLGWGPNSTFHFPQEGGTGGIWTGVADRCIPAQNKRFGPDNAVVAINLAEKTVTTKGGDVIAFTHCVSTMPLDFLLQMVREDYARRNCPLPPIEEVNLNPQLTYSSSHIIGIGIRGENPHGSKCWLYFPEDDCPFYRGTVFSHYGKKNVPDESVKLKTIRLAREMPGESASASAFDEEKPGPYWSLMFEVSESPKKIVDINTVLEDTIQGAINTNMISPDAEIVSTFHTRLEHGYPTPFLGRDDILDDVLPWLKERGIYSRGRFGSWKYEVGNQDHSCMVGVEAIDNIMYGAREFTLNYCGQANERGKKYMDMRYKNNLL